MAFEPAAPDEPDAPGSPPEPPAPRDSPVARWSWTLRLVLLLAAMAVIPAVVHQLTTPDPVVMTVTVPTEAGTPDVDALAERIAAALDGRSTLDVVPWNRGRPEGADLVLEVEPIRGGGAGEEAAPGGLRLRLYRWPGRERLWEGGVEAASADSLVSRAARAVGEAVWRGG